MDKRSSSSMTKFPTATSTKSTLKSTLSTVTGSANTEKTVDEKKKLRPWKLKKECSSSSSSSHTHYYKIPKSEKEHKRVNVEGYLSLSESLSSSDTFHCVHGPEGKQYTQKGLLKRNILKTLDPIKPDKKWTDSCPLLVNISDLIEKIIFLASDPTIDQQKERFESLLYDFIELSKDGYRVDVLDKVCFTFNYLVDTLDRNPQRTKVLTQMLQLTRKPILLIAMSDFVHHFDTIRDYIAYLGYLLMRLEHDDMFDIVSQAVLWHLSAPDHERPSNAARLQHTLAAGAPALYECVAKMLAVSTVYRFKTFLDIALILMCNSAQNCAELLHENILENIFYRFNPYFPDYKLPLYDVNPKNPQDMNIKLGASSIHITTTISVLLVLTKSMKDMAEKDPKFMQSVLCPDSYSQRCFIWAYRYECREPARKHQRICMTVIAQTLIYCYKRRLETFCCILMQDVLALSVLTEIPARASWIKGVNFATCLADVTFKKVLVKFSVFLLKLLPMNHFMAEHHYWLLGLSYLIDPGLCSLRARWAPSLYSEIKSVTFHALALTVSYLPADLIAKYGLMRRVMWYIEWYSESPFELKTLYWCVRILHALLRHRGDPTRKTAVKTLFDSHGVIIIVHLCYSLLANLPPVEKAQVIISLCLRILTSALEYKSNVQCVVYPSIQWPRACSDLAVYVLDVVLHMLERNYIVNQRLIVALMNFLWEAIIWNPQQRQKFIKKCGIYKLLDIVTMTPAPVQCITLALICDVVRAGDAVCQLVSWRAKSTGTALAKRGSTIAVLLASIFKEECLAMGVPIDDNGIIQEMDQPIMSTNIRKALLHIEPLLDYPRTFVSYVAGDIAGSRLSKAFAILHMLSEDLEHKVSLADEAYRLYKNIKLVHTDENILLVCSNYLTLKFNEAWMETKCQVFPLLSHDERIIEEFLQIGRGWANDIKRQQLYVMEQSNSKDLDDERNLYEFLGRVRLNIALDALREVRCGARSADRTTVMHALMVDAVHAHSRRAAAIKAMDTPLLKTYEPKFDDKNLTGQNIKTISIKSKVAPSRHKMCKIDY